VVQPLSIDQSFEKFESSEIFTDAARLATEEFWSPYFRGRRSAKGATSVFEYSRPMWSKGAEEKLDAFFNQEVGTDDIAD